MTVMTQELASRLWKDEKGRSFFNLADSVGRLTGMVGVIEVAEDGRRYIRQVEHRGDPPVLFVGDRIAGYHPETLIIDDVEVNP